jgi:hypothetical protein
MRIDEEALWILILETRNFDGNTFFFNDCMFGGLSERGDTIMDVESNGRKTVTPSPPNQLGWQSQPEKAAAEVQQADGTTSC